VGYTNVVGLQDPRDGLRSALRVRYSQFLAIVVAGVGFLLVASVSVGR